MKDSILVDTSVWIEFFKLHSETGDKLEKLIKEHLVWTCGVIIFELIKGLGKKKKRQQYWKHY